MADYKRKTRTGIKAEQFTMPPRPAVRTGVDVRYLYNGHTLKDTDWFVPKEDPEELDTVLSNEEFQAYYETE